MDHHTHNHEIVKSQISEQEGSDQDVELWMERDKKDCGFKRSSARNQIV